MKIEDLPDGFKLSIGDQTYKYDKEKNKWFLGRKEVPQEQTSMFKYIVAQIDTPPTEGVSSSTVELNQTVVKEEAELLKSPKALPKVESAKAKAPQADDQQAPEETKDDSVKELLKILKASKQDQERSGKKKSESLLVRVQNVAELAKAFVDALQKKEQVKRYSEYFAKSESATEERPYTRVEPTGSKSDTTSKKKKDENERDLGSLFKSRMRDKNPWLRFFTDKMETAESIKEGLTPKSQILNAFESIKSGLGINRTIESTKTSKAAITSQEELIDKTQLNKKSLRVKIENISELSKQLIDSIKKGNNPEGRVYDVDEDEDYDNDYYEEDEISQTRETRKQSRNRSGRSTLEDRLPKKQKEFKPKYGTRAELEKMSDLTEGERELLKNRGVAPASEKDMFYRKDGKVLNKTQLLEELDEAHNESPLKKGFKARMREKNPWLRFFTNKMETPEDIAKGRAPKQQITGAWRGLKDKIEKFNETPLGKRIAESEGMAKARDIFKVSKVKPEPGIEVADEAVKAEQKTAGKIAAKGASNVGLKTAAESVATGEAAEMVENIAAKESTETAGKTGAKTAEKVIGKEAAEAVGKTGAKTAEKVAIKGAGKAIAKGLGKSVLKKIPGISILAGLAFGAQRLMKGDVLGAVGEGLSGLAGTVPLYGTAASVGIDAALAARDIAKSNDNPDATPVTASAKGNAFSSIRMFKDGGIVSGPTAFEHSEGIGIMGEAGPEAVMPLQRSSDGKLGVKAEPVSKPMLTDQSKDLKLSDTEMKKKDKQQPQAPVVINTNNNTNNTMAGGGGSGGRAPTASSRGSLATNYFAF